MTKQVSELIDDIIALGSDHPNGAFDTGLKNNGEYAPQNKSEAVQALLSHLKAQPELQAPTHGYCIHSMMVEGCVCCGESYTLRLIVTMLERELGEHKV